MSKYKQLAADIIEKVGGEDNIAEMSHCMTRLRLSLKDDQLVNKEALEQLPERLRLPLVLHYAEGMSYAEIAEALRLPQSTIRSRRHHAREQLRTELEAE